MKFLVFLIIIFVLIIYNLNLIKSEKVVAGKCLKCLNEGDECSIENNSNFKIGKCSNGFICGSSPNDEFTKYECIVPKRKGDSCVDNTVCDIGLLCNPTTHYCDDIRFASINEDCQRDEDCSFNGENGIEISCIDHICQTKSNANSDDSNSNDKPLSCQFDNECPGGNSCVNDICIPSLSEGQDCSADNVVCHPLLFCSQPPHQICKPNFSLKLNQNCTYIENLDIQCELDLTCSKNGICVENNKNNNKHLNNSKIHSGGNGNNCSISNDCKFGYYCDCESGKCLKDTFDSINYIKEKTECIIKNKIKLVDNLYSQSSRFTKYCKDIEVNYQKLNQCNNSIFTHNYKEGESVFDYFRKNNSINQHQQHQLNLILLLILIIISIC